MRATIMAMPRNNRKKPRTAKRHVSRRRHPSSAPKERPFVRSIAPRVFAQDVTLVAGKTRNTRTDKRFYWHVFYGGQRAGHVAIACGESGDGCIDASIDVQLNQRSRGRGIGTVAFRRACELSGLREVLASIRKGNTASRLAAERAGFVELHNEPTGELLMIWKRP
jgi:hypothetical protein